MSFKYLRNQKIFICFVAVIIVFTFLGGRLFYLQVIKGPDLAQEAVYQRTVSYPIGSGRGDILDRNGYSLLDSQKEYVRVAFISDALERPVTGKYLNDRVIELETASSPELLADFAGAERFPVLEKDIRYGPRSLASHLIGFKNSGGSGGLERVFDSYLQQEQPLSINAVTDGNKNILEGIGLRIRGENSYYRPFNLVTTLDKKLQQLVESVLDDNLNNNYLAAAVVILDPATGDVLAMASRPSFDQGNKTGNYFNYAIEGKFMPGSVFKTVISAAALEQGKVTLTEGFNCLGWIDINGQKIYCNQQHGSISFKEAFAYSCNITFIKLAMELEEYQIRDYWRKMGFFQEIDIFSESASSETEPKDQQVKMNSLRQLANIALGQESIMMTPLQGARLAALVANGGLLMPVRAADRLETKSGIPVKIISRSRGTRAILPYTASQLQSLMEGVVAYGTASSSFPEGFPAAGKTGTAVQPELGRQDSWFIGYYPVNNPQYALSVVIQTGTKQSAPTASKLAGKIFTNIHN